MKNIASIFVRLLAFAAILFLQQTIVSAQAKPSENWIRVQSDNGEFSVEVPAKYKFVADKDGFQVSNGETNYSLENMRMLNAYAEKTLISFESYKAKKAALDVIRDDDDDNGKTSEIKLADGLRIKQILTKTDKFYVVRQYFHSEDYIYILTAASRSGETATSKRFLDSLVYKSLSADKTGNNLISGAIPFSSLNTSRIEIDENPEPIKKPDASVKSPLPKKAPDVNALPVTIIISQRPSYTDAARMKGVTGTIKMRATFSADGHIPKIGFLTKLQDGLLRQAFFAAVRMKFLPAEKDEKQVTVTKMVEYGFSLY